MSNWNTTPPPDGKWVEVKDGKLAKAVWGRDGVLPHWELEDGTCVSARYYNKWREPKEAIWKYELEITGEQDIEMPAGATILSVAGQNGKLCLWAYVFPDNPLERRRVEVHGTGNPMKPRDRKFIGTVLLGAFVWHVFEGSWA
jgi:hypothetical protein